MIEKKTWYVQERKIKKIASDDYVPIMKREG
jgi:hypothetical protein